MMGSRMGTPFKHPQTREPFESGTAYEIRMAYRSGADSPTHEPHLLLYRKSIPTPQADPEQQKKVDDFFQKIEQQQGEIKGLYQKFSTPAEFRQMLTTHIEQMLVENPPGGAPVNKRDTGVFRNGDVKPRTGPLKSQTASLQGNGNRQVNVNMG